MPTTAKTQKPKPKSKPKTVRKGGASGDAWPGDAIAGPVTNAMSTPFPSDTGLSGTVQFPTTAAQLASVNVFQGGKKNKTKKVATKQKPKKSKK
jgi:hypothetical protein